MKFTGLGTVVACETVSSNNEIFALADMGYQLAKHGWLLGNADMSSRWQAICGNTNHDGGAVSSKQ